MPPITKKRNILKDIETKLRETIFDKMDEFVIDKYQNLYTETVYDKYGGSMKLA